MNTGTRIRTVLAIVTTINTVLMATDVTGFNNPKVDLAYKIISVVFNAITVGIVTWYNNDYTEIAAENTELMRLEKKPELPEGYFEGEEADDEL